MMDGMYLSWEEIQRLALPPNATMLIPPPLEQLDVPALSAARPVNTDWLDDRFASLTPQQPPERQTGSSAEQKHDEDADRQARSEAEKAQYGSGPLRLLTNLIAMNALLEYIQSPSVKDEEQDDEHSLEREPAKP
jgi:hypothetical protein